MTDQSAAIDANSARTLTAVSSADGTTIVRIYGDPTTHRLLVQGASLASQELTATGTVNGVNTTFTFVSLPTYIISDGVWLKSTDKTSATNWTWNSGSLTATMVVAPQSDIWGIT